MYIPWAQSTVKHGTSAQIFVGTQTLVSIDVYGVKTDKELINTLQDNIRKRGAMDKLISDRAQTEVSRKVLDILRNTSLMTGRVSHTMSTRTQRNADTRPSRRTQTNYLTALAHPLIPGF
jgi:hypothetical protein